MDRLLIPMMLLAGGDKPNQLLTHILPAMIPGSDSQRLLFATLTAKKELKAKAETEQSLIRDAIKAAKFERPEQLKNFPALEAAFHRLTPAAQATMFPAATGSDDSKSPGNPA
jgi:hypothetical protein